LEVYTPPKYSVNTSTASGERSITLGEIVDRIQPTGNILSMNADNLVKHGFVVGQTGYGKTRAVIHLLKELNRIRIPWLVIDPVGEEYRALIGEDDNANVRLFSLGAKNGGGFRFNPFDVPPKVSVQSHIEMVTSVLEMAFSMYTVLPQLLQLAVIGAYQKKGWDMAESAQTDKPPPTLTDLYLTVREMRIDYPAQTTSELRQALLTRIRGLMLGSKGKVLNCQRSVKMDDLLSGPAILELEGIQDPNDKAIVMGLLFGTVAEYVRSNSDYSGTLKHVVVLEEAHNILPNIETDVNNAFQGHPKAKMVETMSNMLAEMRKHGEGIMIVNQIPSELSSRAVKNTNMSLIFRTKDSRDKQMLADSINLTEDQRDFLSNLMPGEAVCFMEDLHHPVMIQVTKTEAKMPSEQEVLKRIQEFNAQHAEIMEAAPRPFVGCELCEEACAHFLDSEAAFMRVLRDQKKLVKVIDYSNKGNFQALAGLIGTELTRLGFKQASIYKTYCFYVQLLNYTEYSTDDRESQIRSSARQFKAYLTSR